ncbi:MAG TPA: tetratricopeptide repeat protein, partial [Proteobacteria bacterium]|nr:tetratricopeptide repeat protein [Pseudomonadota bacterium]
RLRIAEGRGQPEQVIALLDDLERRASSREELISVLTQKAEAFGLLGKVKERLETLEKLVATLPEDDPRRAPNMMSLAEMYVNTGQKEKAAKMFTEIASGKKEDPITGWAKLELANIATENGRFDRADELYMEVLNEYDDQELIISALSEMRHRYAEQNQKKRLASNCERLAKTAKNESLKTAIRAYLTWLNWKQSGKERAAKAMEQVLNDLQGRSDPICWETQLTAARFYQEIGDDARAILTYQQLVAGAKRKPWSTTARIELARLLEDRGHIREALVLQKQLLKMLDPASELDILLDAKFSVGRLYAKLRNHTRAIEHYRDVIRHEPNSFRGAKAQEEFAYSLFALGKPEKAEQIWKGLLQKFPNNKEIQVSVRMRLGEMYVTTKRYREAEAVYREVIERYKDDWRYGFALVNLAKSLYGQGKTAEAKKLLAEVQKNYKDDKLLSEARRLMEIVNSGAPLDSLKGGGKAG